MILGNSLNFDETTVFSSLSREHMNFEQVYNEILKFIKADKDCSYKISVGTDSQVSKGTVFVSCIHVHRIGKGAIGFLHKVEIQRPIKNLREKIYLETCTSLQLAYMFDDEKINRIYRTIGAKAGDKAGGITFEFHIDIGIKGQTKTLINEMVGLVKGINFVPKIKPDSYCASSFADRFTKAI
jgi:predicted RNase H-related nuclease YkuK (DUF458 family)